MKRIIFAAVASILVLTLSSAIASPVASASLTGYRYELIDLNPNDGVDPSIVLTGSAAWLSTAAYAANPGSPYLRQTARGEGIVEVADAAGRASAQWGADGAMASAEGSNHRFVAGVSVWYDFVLSPFTQVIFRAFGTGTQNAPEGYSYGGAQLIAYNDQDDSLPYVSDGTGFGYGPVNRDLILSLISGATALSGVTGYSVNAQSGDEPISVPEPSTIATLLAGLCIIHLGRRKRLGV